MLTYKECLNEAIIKVVRTGADGQRRVSRVLDRASRSRRATQTTGRSKADLKLSARKSARARKRNPAKQTRSLRKRRVTMRKRKSLLGHR